jgi:hypothetical protein
MPRRLLELTRHAKTAKILHRLLNMIAALGYDQKRISIQAEVW